MRSTWTSIMLLLASGIAIAADEKPTGEKARPGSAPGANVGLVILLDEKAERPTLILAEGRLPGGATNGPVRRGFGGIGMDSPFRMVAAGVALSLAVIAIGFWAVRRRYYRRALVTAAVLALLVSTVAAWANAPGGAPPPPGTEDALANDATILLYENARLQVVRRSDGYNRLVLTRKMLKELAKWAAKTEQPPEESSDKPAQPKRMN